MKNVFTVLVVISMFVGGTAAVYAKKGLINSGKPVPLLGNDPVSIAFLAKLIAKDYGGKDSNWMGYATNLAKTLSQLNFTEQQELFYGP
jgi:hypothetical protein